MNHCVYKHTFPDGKVYIGQTISGREEERWNRGKGYQGQQKMYNAIVRYGWDNIRHEILEDCISDEEVNDRERHYIEAFNAVKNGYNTSPGNKNAKTEQRSRISRKSPTRVVSLVLLALDIDSVDDFYLRFGCTIPSNRDDPDTRVFTINNCFSEIDDFVYAPFTPGPYGIERLASYVIRNYLGNANVENERKMLMAFAETAAELISIFWDDEEDSRIFIRGAIRMFGDVFEEEKEIMKEKAHETEHT